jgi:hypothetical protein
MVAPRHGGAHRGAAAGGTPGPGQARRLKNASPADVFCCNDGRRACIIDLPIKKNRPANGERR